MPAVLGWNVYQPKVFSTVMQGLLTRPDCRGAQLTVSGKLFFYVCVAEAAEFSFNKTCRAVYCNGSVPLPASLHDQYNSLYHDHERSLPGYHHFYHHSCLGIPQPPCYRFSGRSHHCRC